jgi:hypothetical protein
MSLREALSNQAAEDSGLSNPLLSGGRAGSRPDYESQPPPVTLGEDGNYYANDNRWTPGLGWSTIVMDEPVYWVPGGVERDRVDSDQWEYDEFGNVVTKDADFAGGRTDSGGALNPSGQWLNEEQLRNRWDSDFGLSNFRKANPNMSFEDYLGMVQETTALQAQGVERMGEDGVSAEYQEVYDRYGVQTKYEGKDGALYEFNGGGYTITRNPVDKTSGLLTGVALGIITAGVGAALAPAISTAMGVSGAAGQAASSAILNMAQQAMLTGDIDFKDALMSAAISYGGAQLGDALEGSGVLSEIGDSVSETVGKFEELISTGNSIADAAIKAGGMSMLTQFVMTGEVDIKQAGLAALMAGGAEAFSEWQASMEAAGQAPTADDLQEIVVEAERVGTNVGEGMTQLDNGLVINSDGQILGNMSDLDLDGDGMLSGNDLQEISVDHNYVDITPNENIYGDVEFLPPADTTSPTFGTKEWADERYSGMSEAQIRAQMERDGFGNDAIDEYIQSTAVDADFNPNMVEHGGGWVENMEQPYTLETRNGEYYIIKDGKLKAISADQYEELGYYLVDGDAVGAGEYMDQQGITSGGNIFGGYDEYGRPTPGNAEAIDDWLDLNDPNATPDSIQIDITDPPPQDPTDSSETNEAESASGEADDSPAAGDGGGLSNDAGGESGNSGMLGGGGDAGAGDISGGTDGKTGGSTGGNTEAGGGLITIPVPYPPYEITIPEGGTTGTPTDTGDTTGNNGNVDTPVDTGDTTGNNGTIDQGGDGTGGTGGDTGGGDTGNGTGGNGGGAGDGGGSTDSSGAGDDSGTGDTGGDTGGSNTNGGAGDGSGDVSGTGDDGGTGGGAGGGNGGDSGGGSGGDDGSGGGDGGDGRGGGPGGGGGGMMSGGSVASKAVPEWSPLEWSALFSQPLTAQQKKAIAPKLGYLQKVRGMLS